MDEKVLSAPPLSDTPRADTNPGAILSDELKECLRVFNSNYTEFVVVSMLTDVDLNKHLRQFCEGNGIESFFIPVMKSEYLIDGRGHLNIQGNQILGTTLAQEYIQTLYN